MIQLALSWRRWPPRGIKLDLSLSILAVVNVQTSELNGRSRRMDCWIAATSVSVTESRKGTLLESLRAGRESKKGTLLESLGEQEGDIARIAGRIGKMANSSSCQPEALGFPVSPGDDGLACFRKAMRCRAEEPHPLAMGADRCRQWLDRRDGELPGRRA